MEQMNTTACIEKYLRDIAFSASYNPSKIKVACPGYLGNVKGQLECANYRLMNVKRKRERASVKTDAMHEDEWAWEIFSQLVLPMLTFVDE